MSSYHPHIDPPDCPPPRHPVHEPRRWFLAEDSIFALAVYAWAILISAGYLTYRAVLALSCWL